MKHHEVRIMFVCMGNICRSPLAHGVFSSFVKNAGLEDSILIESSGTISYHAGELPDPRMRKEARKHGVQLNHRARQFQPVDVTDYDLILAMDNSNLNNLLELADSLQLETSHIKLFRSYDPDGTGEVPDPYYGGIDGFKNVYQIVERTCRNLLDTVISEYGLSPVEGARE